MFSVVVYYYKLCQLAVHSECLDAPGCISWIVYPDSSVFPILNFDCALSPPVCVAVATRRFYDHRKPGARGPIVPTGSQVGTLVTVDCVNWSICLYVRVMSMINKYCMVCVGGMVCDDEDRHKCGYSTWHYGD